MFFRNGMIEKLMEENRKLVDSFGAQEIAKLKELPECYTLQNGLVYSHRDFDKFFAALKKGEKCAIVSGVNASGTLHIGHKVVFDTNLFFQKKYNIPVFIPISDDESYVTGKVGSQEEALKNSIALAKELLAYGFHPKKTFFIIDQVYTNIYNLAMKLSRRVTLSEIRATYGYKNEDNPGMYFYPTVQAAHILLPQEKFKIKHVLVPIGPDEDTHIRISRDLAERAGYQKPSILHVAFLPGLDGEKMSKSRSNGIFLRDTPEVIAKKVRGAYSGGAKTLEEHRKHGGNPEQDMACVYLTKLFLNKKESKKVLDGYRSGKMLSSEIKAQLTEALTKFTQDFQKKLEKINGAMVQKSLLKN